MRSYDSLSSSSDSGRRTAAAPSPTIVIIAAPGRGGLRAPAQKSSTWSSASSSASGGTTKMVQQQKSWGVATTAATTMSTPPPGSAAGMIGRTGGMVRPEEDDQPQHRDSPPTSTAGRGSIRGLEHEWDRPPPHRHHHHHHHHSGVPVEIHRIKTKARQLRTGRGAAVVVASTPGGTTTTTIHEDGPTAVLDDDDAASRSTNRLSYYQSLRSVNSSSSTLSKTSTSRYSPSMQSALSRPPADMRRSYRADQAERSLLKTFHSTRRLRPESRNNSSSEGGGSSSSNNNQSTCLRVVSPTTGSTRDGTTDSRVPHSRRSGDGDDDNETATTNTTTNANLALHDLCGEAVSVDDVAWRNAVHLLSQSPSLASTVDDQRWTPLHICCLSHTPLYMLHALLHIYPEAAALPDDGGRLPLHLLAATTADLSALEVLVQAHAEAIGAIDHHGCTPLLLLLRNRAVQVTFRHVQVLLGMTTTTTSSTTHTNNNTVHATNSVSIRRGEHLDLNLHQLERWRTVRKSAVVTNFLHHNDINTSDYPNNDVRVALRKIATWKAAQTPPGEEENVEVAWKPGGTNIHHHHHHPQGGYYADDMLALLHPAEIPNDDREYPIHLVIQRAFVDRTPLQLDVSRTQQLRSDDDDDDDVHNDDADNVVDKNQTLAEQENGHDDNDVVPPSIVQATSIVRLLAAECPAALTVRDSFGLTPLLHILMQPESPDIELVEMLLGKRSAGNTGSSRFCYDDDNHDHRINAAMLAHPETRQLPLHIVAEEYAANYAMIRAVTEAHPFAKGVQDARGRTPLHLALHSYRRIAADPRVLEMLYKESIAKVVDDYGNTPAHLLLQSRSLPKAESNIYQRIFAASADAFELSELRKLPPWLRAEACATREIQELIVQDLAQPWKTALILLDGVLLLVVITVFRIQMKQYVDSLITAEPIQPWNTFVVYAAGILRLFIQIILGIVAAAIGEFQRLFATNVWYWIGVVATMFCLVTSAQLYGTASPERLLPMGTAATCLLWISLLGYMATWFHGMAVFTGAFGRVAKGLVFPLLTGVALFIAFSQCFYTLLQSDCSKAMGGPPVCTERDAYRVVYYLVRGVPIASPTDPVQLSNDAVLLVAMLVAIMLTFCTALLVTVFVSSASVNFDDIALASYWEPKLALVVAPEDFNLERLSAASRRNPWSAKLGGMWDAANQVVKKDDSANTHWYALPQRSSLGFLYTFLLVPLWCIVGFLSFGLLWPYQVREWLFRPNRATWSSTRSKQSTTTTAQVSSDAFSLREEIADLKHSSSERSSEMKREIRQLKELLLMAMESE